MASPNSFEAQCFGTCDLQKKQSIQKFGIMRHHGGRGASGSVGMGGRWNIPTRSVAGTETIPSQGSRAMVSGR